MAREKRSRSRSNSKGRRGATASKQSRTSRFETFELPSSLATQPPAITSDPHAVSSTSSSSTTNATTSLASQVVYGAPPPPPPPPAGVSAAFGMFCSPFGGMPYAGMVAPPPPPPPPPPPVVEDTRPSVEDFVPSIPKSLLSLVVTSGSSGQVSISGGPNQLPPEFAKLTRESRRCHISGFSVNVPKDVLKDGIRGFFSQLISDVRRSLTERQSKKSVDPNVLVDIDYVVDVSVDVAKIKPFGFVELNNADMITELIELSEAERDRFVIDCGGGPCALTLRRPKDYFCPDTVDFHKVVLQGISSNYSEEKLKEMLECFDADISTFQRNDQCVYCEFDDEDAAKECVEDLHGMVIARRLIIAQHLSEPMRGQLMQAGMRVTPSKTVAVGDDPVSRAASGRRDHVKEILDLTTTLNQAVLNLKDAFPFLEPQFGYNIPVFPTKILVLLNAVDEEELIMDESYSTLLEDLSDELERHGRIKQLIVPRRIQAPSAPKPPQEKHFQKPAREVRVLPLHNPFDGSAPAESTEQSEQDSEDAAYQQFLHEKEEDDRRYEEAKAAFLKAREDWEAAVQHPVHGGIGKVFVEYESIDEATVAQRAIAGKLFRLRSVVTSFLFEDILYPPPEDMEAEADNNINNPTEAVDREDNTKDDSRDLGGLSGDHRISDEAAAIADDID